MKNQTSSECQEEYVRRIHKVQDYMEKHLAEPMTLDTLSEIAGFSKYHFSRIFQAHLHEPLAHYVNRMRMEGAVFFLAHRMDMSITEIAYEVGFGDSAVFSRAFRNVYGISPRDYRNEYSKNCKDSFLLSDYNKGTTEKRQVTEYIDSIILPHDGKVRIENRSNRQVAYVRHTGTYEDLALQYGKLIELLFEKASEQGLLSEDDNEVLAIYHDNPEFGVETQFRTSLCLTVPKNKQIHEDGLLNKMELEEGMYAVGHFCIHPDEYQAAWNYMYREWLSSSCYVPRNSYPFELYHYDYVDTEDDLSEVDIYVPVEPIVF